MNNNQRKTNYQEKYQREFPYNWFQYCIEPLEDIEGWDIMLNDTSGQSWHLHHRDEIQSNGVVVTREVLKSRGQYTNLPASKLVFMTEFEHHSLHATGENNPMHGKTGELSPKYGGNKYGITKEKLYELYVVKRLSLRKIAKKFGCHHKRILLYLRKFGISRK